MSDPATASDDQLGRHADAYMEYNTDRRVTKVVMSGGSQEYTYAYTPNTPASQDPNNWVMKTVETRPDSSTNTVYTNDTGQVLLMQLEDASANKWTQTQNFSSDYHLELQSTPAAFNTFSEGSDNLLITFKATGLIRTFDYVAAGAAAGYIEGENVKNGDAGGLIKLREWTYTSKTVGDVTTVPVASEIVYRSDSAGGSDPVTTSYDYEYHTTPVATVLVSQRTTTLPAVPVGENGPNVTDDTVVEVYNIFGNLTSLTDANENITTFAIDDTTGNVTQQVVDSGGLDLTSDFEYDELGRVTQSLGPPHDVNGVTVRTAQWTVYRDDLHEEWTAAGYASGANKGPGYQYTLVNPVSITKMDEADRTTDEIAAVRSTTAGRLSAGDNFPQSTWIRWSSSHYDDADLVTHSRVYYTIPSSGVGTSDDNYDETRFGYDPMNREIRVESPGGTITREVFDVRGLTTKTWVGTNDRGATDSDPGGGGATGNNMVQITGNIYDEGTVAGNGNLTEQTAYVDAVGDKDRVATFGYDFRNRQTSIDGEIDFYQVNTYDNLDRLTVVERKNTNSGGPVIAKSETLYDNRGEVYQTISWEVNPASGPTSNKLTDNTVTVHGSRILDRHTEQSRPDVSSVRQLAVYRSSIKSCPFVQKSCIFSHASAE